MSRQRLITALLIVVAVFVGFALAMGYRSWQWHHPCGFGRVQQQLSLDDKRTVFLCEDGRIIARTQP